MAINVQYGDISSALGLALRGGQAIRQRQQAAQDTQFLNLVADQQRAADAAHATEVSQALGADRTNAELAMDQQHYDQQNVLKQQQMDQQAAETQARLAQAAALNAQTHKYQDVNQQMKEQAVADKTAKDQEKENAINMLTPEQQAVVRATGRMPYIPNNAGDSDAKAFALLQSESRRMEAEIKAKQDAINKTIEGQLGQAPPDPQLNALKAQKMAIDNEIAKRTQGMIQNGTLNNARIAQQAVQARAAGLIPTSIPQNGNTPGDAPSGSTPVVHDAAEYAALPSGATYIDAEDGKTYRKK